MYINRRYAFSLVELSIVLVILGLLVGGILAGQSLIRASELRSVSSDFAKYQTALMAFRDKYFGLPGDIGNATSFWGKDTTSSYNCSTQTGNAGTPGTCNGSAEGQITDREVFRAWQQLSLSGLIEGQYTGIGGSAVPLVAGVTTPASRLSGGVISLFTTTQGSGNGTFGNAILPDVLYLWLSVGAPATTGAYLAPILTVEEAWNLDVKMDDGFIFQGKVHGGVRSICAASALDPNSGYALSNTTGRCTIGYMVQ